MQRKLNIFVKKFDNFRFYVRPLCELQLFAALEGIWYTSQHPHLELGTEMAISLLLSPLYFHGEEKSIERGENHYKSGHVQSFIYADGKIVGLLHASRRERDVTYETCSISHCVFSTAFNWTIAQ